MTDRMRWILGAVLLLAPLACADAPDDEIVDEEDAVEAVEEEGTLEVPPDESARGAALGVDERAGLGAYLVDADGRALYLFTADEGEDGSACHDACAEVWPPMIAERGTTVAATAEAIRPDLIGTIERPDGRTQVTYGGHPLYLYSEDVGPGEITGQDMHTHGGEWYLVTPEGRALEEEGNAPEDPAMVGPGGSRVERR